MAAQAEAKAKTTVAATRPAYLDVGTWALAGLLVFLVALPFLVQLLTGDSAFGVRGRQVGQSVFWQGLLIETFVLAILAMSYNLLFGFTGIVSFGHALFFGIAGYAMGLVITRAGLGMWAGLGVGVAAGLTLSALLGLLVGLVSLRLRGVYFTLFTLAVAEMFAIYLGRWGVTSAEDGFALGAVPDLLNPARNRLAFYYLALGLGVFTFLFLRRLMHSPTGAVLLAIRENEPRAAAIGYPTLRYKLMSMVFASALAAVAGMLHVLLNRKVGPELLSVTYTVQPLLMTIIGGLGTFMGPVLGAAGIHLPDRLLRNAAFDVGGVTVDVGANWTLILGIAFVVVVLVFPRGLVGTLRTLALGRGRSRKA